MHHLCTALSKDSLPSLTFWTLPPFDRIFQAMLDARLPVVRARHPSRDCVAVYLEPCSATDPPRHARVSVVMSCLIWVMAHTFHAACGSLFVLDPHPHHLTLTFALARIPGTRECQGPRTSLAHTSYSGHSPSEQCVYQETTLPTPSHECSMYDIHQSKPNRITLQKIDRVTNGVAGSGLFTG